MVRFTLFLISLFASTPNFANENWLYVGFKQPRQVFADRQVELANIVYLQFSNGGDAALFEQMQLIKVEVVNGEVNAAKIVELLEKQTGIASENIRWRGSRVCKITVSPRSNNADVWFAVVNELKERLEKHYAKVEVVLLRDKLPVSNREKYDVLRISPDAKIRVNKRLSVWVDAMREDRVVARFPLWFKVKVFDDALVAKDAIATKESLNSTQFETVLVEVTESADRYLSQLPQSQSVWSVAPIRKGQVLLSTNVAPEPAVKRNESVTVELQTKHILIRVRGKSLNEGQVGEQVLVELEQANRPVSAKVVSHNKVRVNTDA